MNKTSFGDIHATGDDRRPSSGEPNVVGQPPITPAPACSARTGCRDLPTGPSLRL
jgi:hypothetical protein